MRGAGRGREVGGRRGKEREERGERRVRDWGEGRGREARGEEGLRRGGGDEG